MAPLVRTHQGLVRGIAHDDFHAFLGLPYAAAPFGPARLLPPRPPQTWTGTRDAVAYGPTAPKGDYPPQFADLFHEIVVDGEQCLNLNIWTPEPGAAGLPVLVWIHGGSYVNGSGSLPEYRGDAFARDGIVLVTINYRLGAEGFLHLPDAESNLGLLDQIAALGWVGDNIRAFGGDPNKVTVAGGSAGAGGVLALLSMSAAAGAFRGAVALSPAGAVVSRPESAQRVTAWMARELGVEPTADAFRSVPPSRAARAASELTRLLQTTPDHQEWGELALSTLPFQPVLDGRTLERQPLDAIAAGAGRDVNLLVGTTTQEARLFLVAGGVLDSVDEAGLRAAIPAYGPPVDPLLDAYRAEVPDASPGDLLAAVVGDWFFRIPALRAAEAHARHGEAGTYVYEFDHRSDAYHGTLGACHGIDWPFVFDTAHLEDVRPRVGGSRPRVLVDLLHGALVAFTRDGTPGWPVYTPADRTTMRFRSPAVTLDDPGRRRRTVWTRHR